MQNIRRYFSPVLLLLVLVSVSSVAAQKNALKIDYTVQLTDPATRQFHITTDIRNIKQAELSLSLPTWTPGWYVVENYGKNLLRFKITDKVGKWLPFRMTKKQTWAIDTRMVDHIRVEYDYRATVLGLNQARIGDDFAFYTGIEIFLGAVGHSNEPSTVHFAMPDGWKVITALKDTADPNVFTAENYDALVDAPAEMGNFDVTRFEVEGKPHHLVMNPVGSFSKEKTERFVDMLSKVAKAQSAMFGGLPYEKYVYFYFLRPAESNASGALEHLNSFVAFAPAGSASTPEMLIGTASHEFFHLWNVKRIRPAEMWPYDYSREQETSLLWVSEGFTNYYGVVATFRAGITSEEAFLDRAASAAAGIESSDARNYISPANSSVSTWVGYDTPVAFGISYYTQGQNLAALLDLSIRNDTDGTSSLDDVMRALFNEHYKRGKGFTTDDLIRLINRTSKRDYTDFFRKYVYGMEVPNYDEIFGYAGYRMDKVKGAEVDLGLGVRFRNGGLVVNSVEVGSGAEAGGLKQGDVILKFDGTPVIATNFNALAGKKSVLTVSRGGSESEIEVMFGSREVTNYKLVAVDSPTPKQAKIRDGWLKR